MSESDMTTYNKLPQWFHLEQSDHMTKPIEADVTGEIPKWINGSMYRNGAGLYKIGPTVWNHLFDGFAVLQRWTFQDGKVTYQSSILDSDNYKRSARRNRLVGPGFGGGFPDPCETFFGRFFNRFIPIPPQPVDNTNVNVMELGDRLFALTESPLINEIRPDELNVKEQIDARKFLAVHLGTAHPHKLKDGTVIYYGTNMNHKVAYNFISIPPTTDASQPFAGAKILASVASRWKMNISYTHSFGITENYFVHMEQPLAVNLPRAILKKQLNINTADFILPHVGESMDIILVDRSTGKRHPILYRAPEGVVFHFINCYEEANQVVCDVCFMPEGAPAVKRAYLNLVADDLYIEGKNYSRVARFVLPLSLHEAEEGKNLVTLPNTKATATLENGSQSVVNLTPELFGGEMPADLPQINYDYNMKKYRYCYTSSSPSAIHRKLAKFDMLEKQVLVHETGEDLMPGEPVFLARPGATREDDGVIVATVMACSPKVQSYLVVLDATSFKEIGRANLPIDKKMTFTFHGIFTDKTF